LTVKGGTAFLGDNQLFSGSDDDLMRELRRLQADNAVHLVVTPNVDQVLSTGSGSDGDNIFQDSSLLLMDGAPLVFLARALGAKGARRYTGADLLFSVAGQSAANSWRVVILGGIGETSRLAAARLREQYPGADIQHIDFPAISAIDDPLSEPVIAQLIKAEPSIVFVCLGSPKQELWVRRFRDSLPPAIYVGAGAAADFAAGTKTRAPSWLQSVGCEWVWRLLQEPKRLARRYLLRGPKFLGVIARSVAAQQDLERSTVISGAGHRFP
jgi:exopolysaccharide biosynthesis WecB/TagA/CpsF family protein